MNSRIVPLLAALLFGLVAVVAFHRLSQPAEPKTVEQAQVEIAFARKTVPRGEALRASAFEIRPVPEPYVTSQMVRGEDLKLLEGERSSVEIEAGQPLLWTSAPLHSASGFAASISPNHRAVTLAFPGRGQGSSLVQPGDRVDIVAVYPLLPAPAGPPERGARMLLQDVPVLAVEARTALEANLFDSLQGTAATHVTLEVSPQEAVLLAFAEEEASLKLLIRNPQDVVESTYDAVTVQTLRQSGGAARAAGEAVDVEAPLPGYPMIIEEGRSIGSGFFSTSEEGLPGGGARDVESAGAEEP